MDPTSRDPRTAPPFSVSSNVGLYAPGLATPLPRVDDRIVMPESRAEIVHGELLFQPPAEEPHAVHHARLAYVLEALIADGYVTAVDMLTRTSERSDFAPDASVFRAERDESGARRLEELAFEIVSEQSIGVPSEKARELVKRGVRRVFCVVVKRRRVLEWSRETDAFGPLRDDSSIDDACFRRPLAVCALLDVVAADDAVAEALIAKEAPALKREFAHREARGEARGELAGRRTAIVEVLAARDISPDAEHRARIEACTDKNQLARWLQRALVVTTAAEMFE